MKTPRLLALTAFTLIAGASASLPVQAADVHHHHGDSHASAQTLRLNAGRQWATDAALRQSMEGINRAMAKALPAIHHDRFGDADYDALAATVSRHVAHAVEHCKLAPAADAQLHLVIAELLAGAEAMEGKTAAPRHDGAVRVLQALKSYQKYFRHPGFKATGT
ncbi:MAG: hypothetical protein JNL99_09115 [Zoogloea sp.]|nr:hypothetical protein [Zoogloea sp.]